MTIRRAVYTYMIVAMLCFGAWISIDTPVGAAGLTHANTLIGRNAAPSACRGVKTYVGDLADLMATTKGGKAFMSLSDMDGDALMAMTPTEISTMESSLRLLVRDLKKMDPPPAAVDLHDDLTKIVELYRQTFLAAETIGFPYAIVPYIDQLNTVADRFLKESKELTDLCGTKSPAA